ncbi:serine/threonine-protein kinase [Streptomyces sp. NBC_00059]|uniref:serine/threonine-protein kinase n=1 Tax=Streptomyces sp. NBC_00059 TaxID=2975635 RepID=UPI00225C009D|nr:serine/threonine-protein kinase [Streptomyces sp. NBC_00059]MCX5414376.1 protein kinase [Streptomyces sp. NBC_00059]
MDELRPQDPTRTGAYQLIARLGAGGMGQVYLGRSPGGRLVAVKVIRDEISDHPEALARFRREAATVEAVRSAYTAQLIEASLDTPPYWLATEYVPGPTLRAAVLAGGPFPPGSALKLFAALAEGLAAVHVHGVTHRDLKPQNVILSPQGPQLIDFGIARGLGQTVLTRDGSAPGTPGFAAPEVVLRNEVGPAADVFALGATLAYTATGRPPYGSGDAAAVSYRAVHEDVDVAGVSPALAALIRECVAKNPADRPDPSAVIARCAVDSPLATDAHYRSLTGDRATAVRGGTGTVALPTADTAERGGPVVSGAPAGPGESVVSGETTAPGRAVGPGEAVVPGGTAAPGETVARREARVPAGADTAARSVGPEGPLSAPVSTPGATPYDDPDRTARPARTGRRGALGPAAVAAVLAASATAWLLSGDPDGRAADGSSGSTGSEATPGPTATRPAAGPPGHILNGRESKDRWTLSEDPEQAAMGMGSCALSGPDAASLPVNLQSSVSHTTGSDTASVQLRPADVGEGKRPAPYYVAVGVRPPHGTDPATGGPTGAAGKGIGFTSKPVDIFSTWSSGDTLTFSYPEDFRAHFEDRTVDAIPVGDDRGDWTVVLYHVEGGPEDFTAVSCNGFHA